MDARLLFPNKFISAADLRGKDVSLTISKVVLDELRTDQGSEKKPVIFFQEMEARHHAGKSPNNKRLVMNKTNMKIIGKALKSYETKEWEGQRITLYPTQCLAFGQTVDCVRVREKAPPAKRRKPVDPEVDPDDLPGDFQDEDEAA